MRLRTVLKPELVGADSVSELGKAFNNLKAKMKDCGASAHLDEEDHPYLRTRSRQSSIGASSDALERDILGDLSDNIDSLGSVLSGILVLMNTATSLGKRARHESSTDGSDDEMERKKLYNGLWFSRPGIGTWWYDTT